MKKVLILGGGFGGVGVYQHLHKFCAAMGVTIGLINRENYLTFTPMLHEAATGSVSRENVAQPLRELMVGSDNNFHEAEVLKVDLEQKIVTTKRGIFRYDVLVSAMGVAAGDCGVPGAKKYGCPIKTLADAIEIREQVITAYERAEESSSNQARGAESVQPCFVVVGGGATGVELAGQLVDLMRDEMYQLYPEVQHEKVRIYLVHRGERILSQVSDKAAERAKKRLEKLGVVVLEKEGVIEVLADKVRLSSGGEIKTTNVFWATGTESVNKKVWPSKVLNDRGLLVTNKYRQVEGRADVFALGDGAVVAEDQYQTPATAQAAVWEARLVANNVRSYLQGQSMQAKKFRTKGDIIPIGDWFAVMQLGQFVGSGRLAWLLRRTVFLFYIYSWGERWRVLSDWLVKTWQMRDTSRF